MTTKDYQSDALTTESPADQIVGRIDKRKVRLLHAALGLTGEAGELADAVKKHVIYGRDLDEKNIKEELGDLMWYIAILCDVLDINIEGVMESNIAKLKTRYPGNKWSAEAEQNRNLDAERQALEDGK